MESFKTWLFSVCGAMILSSLFKTVLSNSSMKKSVNIFFSLFILFYTVIPLNKAVGDGKKLSFETNSESNYSEIYDEAYEKIIEQSVKNICDEMFVDIYDIEMTSHCDEDGIFSVESIKISISQKEKCDEVKHTINKRLGFEVEVY